LSDQSEFIAAFCKAYKAHRRAAYFVRRPKDLVLARLLLETYSVPELAAMVDDLLTVDDEWIGATDRGMGILATKASWLANRQAQAQPAPAKIDWFAECAQTHNGECGLNQQRHAQRVWNDAYKARESA
jgi:hypothetical protein